MPKIHIPDVPVTELRSPAGKFHSHCQNITLGLGGIRGKGTAGGGHPFDLQIRRVPPGAAVCPYHAHTVQWELFVVLSGAGTVRANGERHAVAAGDTYIQRPGVAHQTINTSNADLELLIIADNPAGDACFYPDSGKWTIAGTGQFFRINPLSYFEGEEPVPAAEPAPHFLAPADTTPFKKVRIDDLAWEEFTSPKKKFTGGSKELSIALGAQRKAPSGLGGHPFDLELQKLPPGAVGCPYHFHSAQWELYYILSGEGAMRTAAGMEPLRPGDVILHPPGEAHQIRNTSTTADLLFYVVADNPPVDYWHYPDSNKWGHPAPRQFFRVTPLDYWDGEE
ncbi:MAG: cupin domain-containing protein [Verrucomicrobia bacterium]|nr:cupin domain-containing protein [Verrucomicrobiota bacterium]